jgi:hypothetical protein
MTKAFREQPAGSQGRTVAEKQESLYFGDRLVIFLE